MESDPGASQTQHIDDLLRQGIAAAKAKQTERARELLMRVVELDQENISAWMWLSGVVDSLQDREICLENVLALDPDHHAARRGLEWVRTEMEKNQPQEEEKEEDIPDQGIVPIPPPLFDEPEPALPEMPVETADQPFVYTTPKAAPETPWDYPLNPFTCPYCAAPAQEEDQICPSCGEKLWIKIRRREEQSWWLMNVMVVQLFMAIFFTIGPFAILTYVMFRLANSFDPFPLVPVYLGLDGHIAPQIAAAALKMVPRLYILPFILLALYSLAMLVGTYLRWKPIFYLLLGGAGVRMALSIAAIAFGRYYGIICGGAGALFTIGSFFVIFSLEDDFWSDRERIYFNIGRKFTGGVSLIAQGRAYAKQNMWALAALYLRAGVAKVPDQIPGYVKLATAYMHLKRFELAQDTIDQARGVEPDHPHIIELAELLEKQRAQNRV
ncbi:MAG: hypothetical protein JXA89_11390 [Anaerolineae bacterium]|nr:hypothetical protein [Anaerolineae bacterium]